MKKLENKIPKNIIQSKKFSALSDIIYSETVSKDDFSKINSNNVEIINQTNNEDYKTVTYRLKKFTIFENDIIFCHLDSLPELFFQLQILINPPPLFESQLKLYFFQHQSVFLLFLIAG